MEGWEAGKAMQGNWPQILELCRCLICCAYKNTCSDIFVPWRTKPWHE